MSKNNILIDDYNNISSWKNIFGNGQPIKVEIGSGKGQFIVNRALEESECNFVAIEIRRKRTSKIASKIEAAGLQNARVLWANAKERLGTIFPAHSIDTFFIHFPDPWPKRKHERRRLIDIAFLKTLHRILQYRGKVYLTTDVAIYARDFAQLFVKSHGFDTIYAESGDKNYTYHRSIHEWKFKKQGRTIYYFCFCKADGKNK